MARIKKEIHKTHTRQRAPKKPSLKTQRKQLAIALNQHFNDIQDRNSKILNMLTNLARAEVGTDMTVFAATEYVATVKTMVPQLQLMSGGMSVLKKLVNKLLVEKAALENALEREKKRVGERDGDGEVEDIDIDGWGGEGEEEDMHEWGMNTKHEEEEHGHVEVKNDVKHGRHIRFESNEVKNDQRVEIKREEVEDQGSAMEMQSGSEDGEILEMTSEED